MFPAILPPIMTSEGKVKSFLQGMKTNCLCQGLFSKKYPGEPKQWKIKAFKYTIEKYNINTKKISNIICFGDSYIDLEAIESLRYYFTNAFIKIIKFKECPHYVELEKQIWIVISQLDFIVKKVKNLSLKVSKKKMD